MRDLIESLGLGSGALVVALLSLAVVWVLCSRLSLRLGALWAVIVPLIIAYLLYWSPVWLGADDQAQYSAWQFAAIVPWFFAGAFPSALLVQILQRRGAKRTGEQISSNNPLA